MCRLGIRAEKVDELDADLRKEQRQDGRQRVTQLCTKQQDINDDKNDRADDARRLNLQLRLLRAAAVGGTIHGVGDCDAQREEVPHRHHKTNQSAEKHSVGKVPGQRIDRQHSGNAERHGHSQAACLLQYITMLLQGWTPLSNVGQRI